MAEIRAALTREEWEARRFRADAADAPVRDAVFVAVEGDTLWVEEIGISTPIYGKARHKLAALALQGQAEGFTREDVARLRRKSEALRQGGYLGEYWEWMDDLATRIAALLPPEEEG